MRTKRVYARVGARTRVYAPRARAFCLEMASNSRDIGVYNARLMQNVRPLEISAVAVAFAGKHGAFRARNFSLITLLPRQLYIRCNFSVLASTYNLSSLRRVISRLHKYELAIIVDMK